MNRLLSVLLVSLLTLVVCTRTLSRPTSDEETVKNLEIEWAKHSGLGESDIAFQKTIMGDHLVFIDPIGHIYDQTPADFEKITVEMRTKNPDAKVTNEINDIKVRVSGNIATATHGGTYTATGFKDPNANVPGAHYVSVDTWQKQSGKWKVIAGAAVTTEPIPAEAYKTPASGSN
jgi:ketosteroid isomerase-like protein